MTQRGQRTGVRRKLGAGLVVLGLFSLLGAFIAPGASADPLDNVFEPCESTLQGDRDALEKVTDPVDGATVDPGDTVDVELVWDAEWWTEIDVVLDCVFVNGEVVESLSVAEKPGTNDGSFEHQYTIPNGLAAGDEVCDVGRTSGNPSDDNPSDDTHKSNVVCFTVGSSSTTTTSGGGGTTTTTSGGGGTTTTTEATTTTTVVVLPTAVEQTTTTTEAPTTTEGPTTSVTVAGVTVERELARTGTETRDLLALAGMMMLVGGIAVLFGESAPAVSRRRS